MIGGRVSSSSVVDAVDVVVDVDDEDDFKEEEEEEEDGVILRGILAPSLRLKVVAPDCKLCTMMCKLALPASPATTRLELATKPSSVLTEMATIGPACPKNVATGRSVTEGNCRRKVVFAVDLNNVAPTPWYTNCHASMTPSALPLTNTDPSSP